MKKKSIPAPGYYDFKQYFSNAKKNKSGDQENKMCCFIDESKYHAMQTPGQKYHNKHSLVEPRSLSPMMHKATNDKYNRLQPIKKKPDEMGPGEYIKDASYK